MKNTLFIITILINGFCYAQNVCDIKACYYEKDAKFDQSIILLGDNNIGYTLFYPHIYLASIFTYKRKGNMIIRTFDSEYATFPGGQDTLTVKDNFLYYSDNSSDKYRKISNRKCNKLIKRYILPLNDGISYYKTFLERTKSCSKSCKEKDKCHSLK